MRRSLFISSADAGLLQTVDNLVEIVALGAFVPGSHDFAIRLHGRTVGMIAGEFMGSFSVVPEPCTLALLAVGVAALMIARRSIV